MPQAVAAAPGRPRPTRRAGLARTARRHPGAAAGALVIVVVLLVALLAPLLAPYGPGERVGANFASPSTAHPLGLDDIGADVLSLLIYGARVSMLVGIVAAVVSVAIGGLVGLLAGYYGRAIEATLVAVTDYFLVVPVLPLAIVAAALWGPSLRNEIIIIGLLSWPITARTVRAQVKTLKTRTYVRRLRSVGASDLRIVLRHVLPACGPLLMAVTVLSVGNAIFFEAALSFLGLSDASQQSWGKMIADAFSRGAVGADAWWAVAAPGVMIGLVVLSTSMLGRALEDRLNPRLNVSHLGATTFTVRAQEPREEAAR
jgi:peptide/nickel transport system permease protein